MRTTVNLDDDVLRAARNLARARSVSLGDAVSELARRGLDRERCVDPGEELPVFAVSPNAGPITLEDVQAVEDAGW